MKSRANGVGRGVRKALAKHEMCAKTRMRTQDGDTVRIAQWRTHGLMDKERQWTRSRDIPLDCRSQRNLNSRRMWEKISEGMQIAEYLTRKRPKTGL